MNGSHYQVVRQAGVFLMLSLSSLSATAVSVKHSDTTNGVYAEFILNQGEVLASSNQIEFSFVRDTNSEPTTIVFLKKEYFCRLQLLDEQGNNIPLTALGENFGAHFLELTNFSLEALETRPSTKSTYEPFKYWITRRTGNEIEQLPAPEELFQIPGPGQYTLRLQFQVFENYKPPGGGRTEYHRLLRMPSVEIPVKKE
jgi:hypothetical protein